jgi:hypothetical protein
MRRLGPLLALLGNRDALDRPCFLCNGLVCWASVRPEASTIKSKMKLESKSCIVGKDYSAAPTCATCHMSATSHQSVTHDVGDRISWTLRPAISIRLEHWEMWRSSMQDVCSNCHASSWIENFYEQYDGTVDLYNDKFAKPAKAITTRDAVSAWEPQG